MSEILAQTVKWAASTGAPNALVVLALLTQPSTWTDRAVAAIDARVGGGSS
ncbi:hypothetical protein [Halobacterium litoreum]|uniref:Uncharacterized protein n=1 Tax=Halobacterium litoreum TaxID=2039234 RepID=A0ABD5N8U0_9EURY|nr:hypothetical protein [Halobacterium litoreum]UHH14874.1 hypothetical protein LT972_14805 [Halobacterium litoreum]